MKLSVERRSVLDLVPFEQNSKRHGDADLAAIAASIRRFGFNDPIGVTPEGIIVEGHGRWLAAQQLGYTDVPVLVIEGLEERDYDLYRIAHNKIAQSSNFDFAALFDVLRDIVGTETGIVFEDMGFSDTLMGNLHSHFSSPEERETTAPAQANSTPFAYDIIWESKEHKKLFADFLAGEIGNGADKSMGAEIFMAAVQRLAPDLYAEAEAAYPGDISLDCISGTVEERQAHVLVQ